MERPTAINHLASLLMCLSPSCFFGPQQHFEMGHVFEQCGASAVGQRVPRLRLAPDKALVHGDVAGLLELAQVNARVAIGTLDRVADAREVDVSGAGEKGNDGDANAALQHLVDRVVIEVSHAPAGRRRHSRRPGSARNKKRRAAEGGKPWGRGGSAKKKSAAPHQPAATQPNQARLHRYKLTKNAMPKIPATTALTQPRCISPATITATENIDRKIPQPNHSIRSAWITSGGGAVGCERNTSERSSRRSE